MLTCPNIDTTTLADILITQKYNLSFKNLCGFANRRFILRFSPRARALRVLSNQNEDLKLFVVVAKANQIEILLKFSSIFCANLSSLFHKYKSQSAINI